jgi:hypothetical protein
MDVDGFLEFLQTRYRSRNEQPLTSKAASDVVSRCKRVEAILGVDLAKTAQSQSSESFLEKVAAAFNRAGVSPNMRRDCMTAVRRYYTFVNWRAKSRRVA